MTDLAHRGAVPPTPTHLAAQRLLEWESHPRHQGASVRMHQPVYANPGELRSDVRLVAEAVMARSAEPAETCATDDLVREARDAILELNRLRVPGREASEACALSALAALGAVADLARREAALQAEVVRLREALEGEAAQRLRALAEPAVLQAWSSREFEGKWWVSEAYIEVANDRLQGLAHVALDLLGDVDAALKEDA